MYESGTTGSAGSSNGLIDRMERMRATASSALCTWFELNITLIREPPTSGAIRMYSTVSATSPAVAPSDTMAITAAQAMTDRVHPLARAKKPVIGRRDASV